MSVRQEGGAGWAARPGWGIGRGGRRPPRGGSSTGRGTWSRWGRVLSGSSRSRATPSSSAGIVRSGKEQTREETDGDGSPSTFVRARLVPPERQDRCRHRRGAGAGGGQGRG